MNNILREFALKVASVGVPNIKTVEKILSLLIMRRVFNDIYIATRYSSREQMWISEIKKFTKDKSFQYIEFGVWQGSSIKCIANEFKNPKNGSLASTALKVCQKHGSR